MLTTLLLAALPALLQGIAPPDGRSASSRAAAPMRVVSADDSSRMVRKARRAQESFEVARRSMLPRQMLGGGHPCDVVIGRFCRWSDGGDDEVAPQEPEGIAEERERLLRLLDSIGTRLPGDGWIASQRVRYLLEAHREVEAEQVARRCAVVDRLHGWCGALTGLALHARGDIQGSDSAFAAALAAMTPSERCEWTDVSVLLEDEAHDRYDDATCAYRDLLADRMWRLSAPLWLVGVVDFRTEFLSRRTRAKLEAGTRTPFGYVSDDGIEMSMRYGGNDWYSQDIPPAGSMRPASVIGHDAHGPGYNFIPAARAVLVPADTKLDDWDYRQRTSRTRYAPLYAKYFYGVLQHQLAIFRRGDSAIVVAAYDAQGEFGASVSGLEAALFTAPVTGEMIAPADGTPVRHAPTSGVLTTRTAWEPLVVSLEVFDQGNRTAARARYGVRPPSTGGRVTLSDILLYAPRDSNPHNLDEAIPLAIATNHVNANRPLGLFWETYGVRPEGEVFGVSLTVQRIGESWLKKAFQRIGLAPRGSPLSLQWAEVPDRGTQTASRSIAVDLSRLSPGRYEIRLSLTPRGANPVVATRQIFVER